MFLSRLDKGQVEGGQEFSRNWRLKSGKVCHFHLEKSGRTNKSTHSLTQQFQGKDFILTTLTDNRNVCSRMCNVTIFPLERNGNNLNAFQQGHCQPLVGSHGLT